MKKIYSAMLLVAWIGSLMSCIYVYFYNHVGVLLEKEWLRNHDKGVGLFSLTSYFLDLQWYAFIVPFIGIALGLRLRKSQNEIGVFWVSALMVTFALGWAFLAIFVWLNQSVPVYG
jgi:hypothetical protein